MGPPGAQGGGGGENFQILEGKKKMCSHFREYKSGNRINNMLNVSPDSCLQCRPTRLISSIFKRNFNRHYPKKIQW